MAEKKAVKQEAPKAQEWTNEQIDQHVDELVQKA